MIRRLERLRTPQLLGVLSAVSAVSLCADALSPLLITHAPLLLIGASPRSMYVVAVAHRLPLFVLIPLVTLRLCLTDPFHFELGRRIPPSRPRRLVERIPGAGVLVAVAAWPVSHTLLAAGAANASRRRVAIGDVAGTALRVGLMCFVFARIDSVVAAARVASHIGPVAVLSVFTYGAIALVMRRRERAAADGWDNIANQVEALRLEERVREAYGLSWPEPAPGPARLPLASSEAEGA